MDGTAGWEEDSEEVWTAEQPAANFFANLHSRIDAAAANFSGFPIGKEYILEVLETIPPVWAAGPIEQLEEIGIKADDDPETEEKFQKIVGSKQSDGVRKAREFYDGEFWNRATDEEEEARGAMFEERTGGAEAEEGVEKLRLVVVPGAGVKAVPVPGDACPHCHHHVVVGPEIGAEEDWLIAEYPAVERPPEIKRHYMDPFLGIDPVDIDIQEVEEEEKKREERKRELSGGDKKDNKEDRSRPKPDEEEELWKDPRKLEMSSWFKAKMTHRFADTASEGTQTEKVTLFDDEIRTLTKDIKALRLEVGSKGVGRSDRLLLDRIPNREVPTMKDFDAIFGDKSGDVGRRRAAAGATKSPVKLERKERELYEAQAKAKPSAEIELSVEEICAVGRFVDIRGEKVVLRRDLDNDDMPDIETRLRDIFKCSLVIQDTHVPARKRLLLRTAAEEAPTTSKPPPQQPQSQPPQPQPKNERKKKHEERAHRNKSKHLTRRKDRGKDLGGTKSNG